MTGSNILATLAGLLFIGLHIEDHAYRRGKRDTAIRNRQIATLKKAGIYQKEAGTVPTTAARSQQAADPMNWGSE